jgi:hypothetical protein
MHEPDEPTAAHAEELRADIPERASFDVFWAAYLLHHTHPTTRRLHFVGTLVVFVGTAAAVASRNPVPAFAAVLVGYACAFAGHWAVERNQPLTLKSPIRAGLCNLRLFALECLAIVRVGGGYRGAVTRALAVVPLAVAQACTEVPDNQ